MSEGMWGNKFHSRCGELIVLSNSNKTAVRSSATHEFNHGLVFSHAPLNDYQIFEVIIEAKVNSWSGGLQIGVTPCNPASLELPASAMDLRSGTWIMSGSSVSRDGRSVVELYGSDLDQLAEGDTVGVSRSHKGELVFYVNGSPQGIAGSGLPAQVWAVVDLYGKCSQASITNCNRHSERDNRCGGAEARSSGDRLRFHSRHGSLVLLTAQERSAERRRPLDEFNNGVVLTHRPLRDDELFEIRIDRLVDKWSGSIEAGITTHCPDTLKIPATMTNLRTGTIMMSGSGILTNGKGTRREYGTFNLDELKEGDRIAMMRRSNGTLHFFINGLDQGVAATNAPPTVWGVVDLYGMTVKVSIVDDSEDRVAGAADPQLPDNSRGLPLPLSLSAADPHLLTFHTSCGSHAAVLPDGRTAHRPNAMDDFNNGVVMTARHLRPQELFEVRLDKVVTKWAGSIEIGVTTHGPTDLEYPSTMTNVRSGTWMMTGNGVMHNGTAVLDDYGHNLDRLKVGDRVGVTVHEDGRLHFFVNGVDQGVAALGVPRAVYGVVDLYGQAAQVTIVERVRSQAPSPAASTGSSSTLYSDLKFHQLHGRNARVSMNGATASRPNAHGEFNESIIMSNRPLRDAEVFEVIIERMVDRWSGSIEAGVTLVPPEELKFPRTMTDIDFDTWMISGSAVMKDGKIIRNRYRCDLDTLGVGSRLGLARLADSTLHVYINGEDQGVACDGVPPNVYAVIDLYGQCAQVSVLNHVTRLQDNSLLCSDSQILESSQALSILLGNEIAHRFSLCCGKNVNLRNNNTTAVRLRGFSNSVIITAAPLLPEELLELRIEQLCDQFAGSLRLGLTCFSPNNVGCMPSSLDQIPEHTWWVEGSEVRRAGGTVRTNYCPSLDRLRRGDRVGIRCTTDNCLRLVINGEDMGVAASGLPRRVWGVAELYGRTQSVTAVSTCRSLASPGGGLPASGAPDSPVSVMQDSLELGGARPLPAAAAAAVPGAAGGPATPAAGPSGSSGLAGSTPPRPVEPAVRFRDCHGRNIALSNKGCVARRVASYNQGLVLSAQPLRAGQLFEVRIERLLPCWSSSVMVGVCCLGPERERAASLPVSALGLRRSAWCIASDAVFHNGVKVRGRYGVDLDTLSAGHLVGVLVDAEARLHLFVNGVDQGVAAGPVAMPCYALVDLYGQCVQVSISQSDPDQEEPDPSTAGSLRPLGTGGDRAPGELAAAVIKNCTFQSACLRFRSSLGLPDEYFSPEPAAQCLCEPCCRLRGGSGSADGPAARPAAGWCRLPLAAPTGAAVSADLSWHTAFAAVRLGDIRRTLDRGQLLVPGELGMQALPTGRGKDDDSGRAELVFYPALRQAAAAATWPPVRYSEPSLGRVVASAALEVRLRPGAYTADGPRWMVKERAATALSALLLRLEPA
ncbi:neuralized-like protein 4 isoform X2 [Amphibalanus amphitrite]|uniref:neuralized-like protein 4 isoform X2 n=1 Tax=Amphibalanus amphitrite TaxID=1232801 RepID=UPI001C920BEE|nr:neuralized-like protein 4 isoform X2 [Amphibalanus amphitrite]